jgi:formamidopyrimidine-DNA glycosylase
MYVDLYGREGKNVPNLKAYGREGERCRRRCGGTIKKIRIGGRGAHYCPQCQR